MRLSQHPVLSSIVSACALLALTVGLFSSHSPSQLSRVVSSGELRVVMSNPPSGEFGKQSGDTGFDYRLLLSFAEYLGVELRILAQPNLAVLESMVATQSVDMGASHSSDIPTTHNTLRLGPAYLSVKQQLIYKNGRRKPKTANHLIGQKTSVEYASRQAASLRKMQSQTPELQWDEKLDQNPIKLIEKVHNGELDYAIVNSNIYDISRSIYPQVSVAFDVSEEQDVAWMFSRIKDQSLITAAERFMDIIRNNGVLEELTLKHYQHIEKFNYVDAMAFYRRMRTELPKWKDMLKTSGANHNLDWHLLAAISYQESQWNERARSYTGVRGLMMLTNATAKEMKVHNRVDPEQSIEGGAGYFKKLFSRLPEGIQGEDRTWFALAAYNIGYGHLEDARVLTQRQGGNPNHWDQVIKRLPLLSQKKYYKTLRRGYARGREPVKYVNNIRQFYDILVWQDELAQRQVDDQQEQPQAVQSVELEHDERDLIMSLL